INVFILNSPPSPLVGLPAEAAATLKIIKQPKSRGLRWTAYAARRLEVVIFAAEHLERLIREQSEERNFFGSFLVTKKNEEKNHALIALLVCR
ncbi:MAG: hypothetical protein K9M03_04420, partial [Kiritimatiellales bacterium]|nr:hypothetical protein [Kiritimatiellales bacterium]